MHNDCTNDITVYNRFDVFDLRVNRRGHVPAHFSDQDGEPHGEPYGEPGWSGAPAMDSEDPEA